MRREDIRHEQPPSSSTGMGLALIDARGIPTRVCPQCGGDTFIVNVVFDDAYEITFYHLDAECLFCGCLVTAPTPLDLPEEHLEEH